MSKLLMVALAGFAAQLIDGSLGMAFGVTASTGLLAVGTAPAIASASAAAWVAPPPAAAAMTV